jgi:hypothetical protein
MKRFLVIILLSSLLLCNTNNKDWVEVTEVGTYQLAIAIYESKKGITYIVETVLDTRTGKVVTRRKKKASRYKLPYKGSRGQLIHEE